MWSVQPQVQVFWLGLGRQKMMNRECFEVFGKKGECTRHNTIPYNPHYTDDPSWNKWPFTWSSSPLLHQQTHISLSDNSLPFSLSFSLGSQQLQSDNQLVSAQELICLPSTLTKTLSLSKQNAHKRQSMTSVRWLPCQENLSILKALLL